LYAADTCLIGAGNRGQTWQLEIDSGQLDYCNQRSLT
jgi:hypothetical protein